MVTSSNVNISNFWKKYMTMCLTFVSFATFFLLSAGYLGLYIAYVLTVIVSAYVYNRQKHQLNESAQSSGREHGEETFQFLAALSQNCWNCYSKNTSHTFYPLKVSLQFLNWEHRLFVIIWF